MDWDQYRYLLALARGGNFSRAAEELRVVRTTVGRRLDAMEASLGARLFDRTPEGLVPTAAGQALINVATRFEDEALAAEAVVMGQDAELQGDLRVSTLDFLSEEYIDLFASFADRYPGVVVTIVLTEDKVSLRRREADVVMRLSNDPGESLVGRRIAHLSFTAYAHRSVIEQVGENAPLSAYPWLSDDLRGPTPWFDQWLAANAPGARVKLRFDAFPTLRAALLAGVGAAFFPVAEANRNPDLVQIPVRHEPFDRDLWVLTLPELRTNSKVRAFMDHAWEFTRNRRS